MTDLAPRRFDEPISMRVSLRSDGTAGGTVVTDADTGERIGGVIDLHLYARVGQPVEVTFLQRGAQPGPPQRVHATVVDAAVEPLDRTQLLGALRLMETMIDAGERFTDRSRADVEQAKAMLR